MLAGARAARGAVTAADQELRAAATDMEGSSRRWLYQATLLLAQSSGRPVGRPPPGLMADTTSGGLLVGGIWAAMAGDTSSARARLELLQERPTVQLRRLSHGPRLLQAHLQAAQGRWQEVVRLLGRAAVLGERDGGDLDQVPSLALRWLLADAYQRLGRTDSAAAYFERTLDPTGTPFNHLALRGLAYSFAQRRLALLYARLDQPRLSQQHWSAFLETFTAPDPSMTPLKVAIE
jgi:tetratricopeptide (TPR) repeat protein